MSPGTTFEEWLYYVYFGGQYVGLNIAALLFVRFCWKRVRLGYTGALWGIVFLVAAVLAAAVLAIQAAAEIPEPRIDVWQAFLVMHFSTFYLGSIVASVYLAHCKNRFGTFWGVATFLLISIPLLALMSLPALSLPAQGTNADSSLRSE